MRERDFVSPRQETPQSSDQEIDFASLHGGVYDVFPEHKQELFQATVILKGIASGELSVDQLDEVLLDPQIELLFTTERPELGHRSALSYIRRGISLEVGKPVAVKGRTT